MNLDDKISQSLKQEAKEIDQLMAQDDGLFAMLGGIFKGSMRGWVVIVNLFAIGFSALFIWCAYQAWIATSIDDRVLWGIGFIAALQVQIALKMWLFMEMGRNSTVREIKRVEIELARMKQELTGSSGAQ